MFEWLFTPNQFDIDEKVYSLSTLFGKPHFNELKNKSGVALTDPVLLQYKAGEKRGKERTFYLTLMQGSEPLGETTHGTIYKSDSNEEYESAVRQKIDEAVIAQKRIREQRNNTRYRRLNRRNQRIVSLPIRN